MRANCAETHKTWLLISFEVNLNNPFRWLIRRNNGWNCRRCAEINRYIFTKSMLPVTRAHTAQNPLMTPFDIARRAVISAARFPHHTFSHGLESVCARAVCVIHLMHNIHARDMYIHLLMWIWIGRNAAKDAKFVNQPEEIQKDQTKRLLPSTRKLCSP